MAIDTLGANALASNSVTSAKIADDAVVAADITDGSVTTAKLADKAVTSAKALNLGRRNLVINGSMVVWQRATAATTAANGFSTVDRWRTSSSTDGAYTTEKSTDHPLGSGCSIKAQVTNADASLGATQHARLFQYIEAQNLQHLLYGTSSAKTLTLSFWVKSSKTGTYSIMLRKPDNTAYHFIHSYTISSANTWEKKTITITPTAGSTSFITAAAGAIDNDIGLGLELAFNFAQGATYAIGTSNTWSSDGNTYGLNGQVNWMDNTSNNFYLSEVQLEVGSVATDFEHLSFGEELKLCQRYYQHIGGHSDAYTRVCGGLVASTSRAYHVVRHTTSMRQAPSLVATVSEWRVSGATTKTPTSIAATRGDPDQTFIITDWSGSGFTPGESCELYANNSAAYVMKLSAEL